MVDLIIASPNVAFVKHVIWSQYSADEENKCRFALCYRHSDVLWHLSTLSPSVWAACKSGCSPGYKVVLGVAAGLRNAVEWYRVGIGASI